MLDSSKYEAILKILLLQLVEYVWRNALEIWFFRVSQTIWSSGGGGAVFPIDETRFS